jgi:starch phosphorylase
VLRAVSLIEEDNGRRVRMGNLAFLGSHSVNGVSALHSKLMKSTVFSELHKLYPQRINNKTNGITFRRWLYQANPPLTAMLVEALGPEVLDDPEGARPGAVRRQGRFPQAVRRPAPAQQACPGRIIQDRLGVTVNPEALFDVQVKRIHEYKRQLLNLLHTVALYQAMRPTPAPTGCRG